jgi:hypothetical protein
VFSPIVQVSGIPMLELPIFMRICYFLLRYRTCSMLVILLLVFMSCACSSSRKQQGETMNGQSIQDQSVIEIDLTQLDENGLRGPDDGKVAVSYEFSIPDTEACKKEVAAIDPSVEFMPGSRGRIGSSSDACLCIGSTHQVEFRTVLQQLAALSYVDRIIEAYFE